MATMIRLKFPGYCADESCGAYLPVGSLARIYRGGKIYGAHCHTKSESIQGEHSRYRENEQIKSEHRGSRSPFLTDNASVADILQSLREGKTIKDLTAPPPAREHFGTPCGHEDYPCCGCSDEYNQRIGWGRDTMKGFSFFFGIVLMTIPGIFALAVFTLYVYQAITHAQQFAFLW
jgi:hypothetical protein